MKRNRKIIITIVVVLILALGWGAIAFHKKALPNLENIVEETEAIFTEKPAATPKKPSPAGNATTIEQPAPKPEPLLVEEPSVVEETETLKIPAEPVVPKNETRAESTGVYVPPTKSLFGRNVPLAELPKSKLYYEGKNGHMESHLTEENGRTIERLTSYDADGNKVDELALGYLDNQTQARQYAVLSQDKIFLFEQAPNNPKEEIVTRYYITTGLRFTKGHTYKKLRDK
ncbi:MAG: hypothetical protein LBN18_04365 [Dysgonamonadaceae bacterium]|jgi:hypothetical protein|nr:hypothetical protein [Dysgonamonadaceae bacterium]